MRLSVKQDVYEFLKLHESSMPAQDNDEPNKGE
jgi:hypothetical protein